MASIFAPVLYLGLIVGGMGIFSYIYRKRARTIQLEPYFPSHPERDAYITLLQQTDPPAFEGLLKAALICRAMTNVRRLMQLREDKGALQALLQKGAIGDDLWNSLLQAEKELNAENLEVIHEANSFAPGWGAYIYNSAAEMVNNQATRKTFTDIQAAKEKAQRQYKKALAAPKATVKPKVVTKPPAEPTNGKQAEPAKREFLKPPPKPESTSPPSRPTSPSISNGNLSPPAAGTDGESVASTSDNEQGSPQTPSKKPKGKKGKKRK